MRIACFGHNFFTSGTIYSGKISYLCGVKNQRYFGMKFTKMHGAGNDYIYINCLDGTFGGDDSSILENTSLIGEISERLSDRHFGIGADGIILILPSNVADFRMRMFNADGSEGRMCGNATRCIGKYVFDNHYTDKKEITLENASGVKYLTLHTGTDGLVDSVTVDMGVPVLEPREIPVAVAENGDASHIDVSARGADFILTAVSMGNPHGVVFVDEITDELVHGVGRELETDPIWPDRANIEFARMLGDNAIEMRVWERGSGETLACGTGACATAVAAMLTGRTAERQVTVRLIGGQLSIRWDSISGHVFMTGGATTVFEGEISLQFRQ